MKLIICLIICIALSTSLLAQVTTDMVDTSENQNFVGVQGFTVESLVHFKDSWKDATGFFVTYGSISTSNHWSLIFQTGYFSFNANEDAGFTGDEYFNIIPIQIGTRYYLALDRFRPFLLAMSGFNIIDAKYTVDETSINGTEVKVNFQVGAGLGTILFSNLEIEGQVKYNSHLIEPSLPYNITGFEYGVALNWYLR